MLGACAGEQSAMHVRPARLGRQRWPWHGFLHPCVSCDERCSLPMYLSPDAHFCAHHVRASAPSLLTLPLPLSVALPLASTMHASMRHVPVPALWLGASDHHHGAPSRGGVITVGVAAAGVFCATLCLNCLGSCRWGIGSTCSRPVCAGRPAASIDPDGFYHAAMAGDATPTRRPDQAAATMSPDGQAYATTARWRRDATATAGIWPPSRQLPSTATAAVPPTGRLRHISATAATSARRHPRHVNAADSATALSV